MIVNWQSRILINFIIIVCTIYSSVGFMVDLCFFSLGEEFDWLFAYCFEKDHKILTFVEVTFSSSDL